MQQNKSNYFIGLLVNKENEKDFRREELKRKKGHIIEKCITKDKVNEYLNKNYEIYKEYKTSCWMKKEKDIDKLLEDEIWLLFKKMGFEELNSGYDFRINVTPLNEKRLKTKQIDVFAKDDDKVFVIECKSREILGHRSLRKEIAEMKDNRIAIERSIRNYYNTKKQVVFLFCTRNIIWNENDLADAKGAGIIVWDDKSISYFKKLSDHIVSASKYQLFAHIFRGIKFEGETIVPAIKGTLGGKNYYLFMAQPEKLLKIAYVHHRSPYHLDIDSDDFKGNAYQRMIDKSRRKKISDFINKGGFFANNIIINFTKQPEFIGQMTKEDIGVGLLQFPSYYASAWIIDGQHRLYGYADTQKNKTDMIPVLAFYNLSTEEEGKLFVTINKEQKAVEANLLWDLYGEIYEESLDDDKRMLCTISRIVKNLNNRGKSPFYNNIYIPSFNERENRLTIATFANALKKTYHGKKLIGKNGLLYRSDWKTTENFATARLESFFNIIRTSLEKDWNKGEKGFICSNNGVAILIRMLPEFLHYINFKHPGVIDKSNLSDYEKYLKELVSPFTDQLKKKSEEELNNLRKITSNEGLREKTADDFLNLVKRYYKDFAPYLPPTEEELAKELVEETERHIRKLILDKLKGKFGDKWWRQGIPGNVKEYADNQLKKEIQKVPWKKEELEKDIERRLDLLTIGHYPEIFKYGDNWELFEPIFKSKNEIDINFQGFYDYRNGVDHIREFSDEVHERKCFWSMQWIRKCIGLEK